MFITKIKIKNYRLFSADKYFEIPEINIPNGSEGSGLTVFVGENGCGKTSLLEAISLPLLEYKTENFTIHDLNSIEEKVEIEIIAGLEFEVDKTVPRGNFKARGFKFDGGLRSRESGYLSSVVKAYRWFIPADGENIRDGSPDLRVDVDNPYKGRRFKENDVLYKSKEYDPLKRNDVKVPGRIIMNTQTIAVYRDESFNSALFTFNLQDTVFKYSNTDHCCFFLINANRQYEMCGFNNNCGSKANPIWAKGWSYDFDYFQKKCFRDLKENQLDLPPPPVMLKTKVNSNQPGLGKTSVSIHLPSSVNNNQLLPGVADAAKDIVGARKQAIEQEIDKNAETELDKKVQETQKVSLTAIRREINLEDMIKDEENQKGQDEVRELTVQVQQEKKKKQVLEQALQMREKSYEKVKSTKTVQKQIESIKQEAKVDIKFKRAVLKQKIAQIRAKSKRKSRLLQQQINLIRSEMAEEIMAANKKGNAKQCYEDRNDLAKISYYCNNNFSDDYIKNNSCKDAGNFCYNCCENEFGNMYIDQRDDCQSKCDDLEKEELKDGDWVWSKDAENTPTAPMAKTASDANTNVVSNTSTITTNTNIINN